MELCHTTNIKTFCDDVDRSKPFVLMLFNFYLTDRSGDHSSFSRMGIFCFC